jgi:N-acetyl-gamma-glutamyl-phosphate reductase
LSGFDLPKIISISEVDFTDIEAVFACLPHGSSQEIIINLHTQYPHLKIIDLSADFRLCDPKEYEFYYKTAHLSPQLQKQAVYGLSEVYREQIKSAKIIACPGCYPTSIILPLKPLIQAKAVEVNSIISDSKSGISGAGRKESAQFLFSERSENVLAYSLFAHRHLSEIRQELGTKITFTPHLVPTIRGILSTIYAITTIDTRAINDILIDKYKNEPFVEIVPTPPSTKEVIGTNKCRIYAQVEDGKLIIVSVIDNLYKGSSGQAVQNFNLAFGLEETHALNKTPLIP